MNNKFGKQLGEYLEFYNISIKEFADRIDTSSKNLIDIINGTIELSMKMINNISFVTNIPVNYIVNVEQNFKIEKNIKNYIEKKNITIRDYIKRFSYKELSNKYGILYSNEKNDYRIASDILKYLRITNPECLDREDNTIFYKSKNEKKELLSLWLERCYKLSLEQKVNKYNKKNIDTLVSYIKDLAKKNIFDEKKLISKFNECGIYLVIENDLKGSKIRGAFKVLNDKPAIFITKKHMRYADIYFALLHELAHCKSDYNRAKSGSIISKFDVNEIDDFELKADKQAFNWMIDDKDYKMIKNNLKSIDENKFVKSFVVYRLANDGIINYNSTLYQHNNLLIN